MKQDQLETVARIVTQAVNQRLGNAPADMVQVVVREVLSAMSGANAVPAPSTPAPPAASSPSAVDNGDGTITTGLGAVVPRPAEPSSALDLCSTCVEQERRQAQDRAVLTCSGRNARGVVARISREVADGGGDIQDISQTIVAEFFTMIMVVNIASLTTSFEEFRAQILRAASELGIHAVVMHEDVLRSLQRV